MASKQYSVDYDESLDNSDNNTEMVSFHSESDDEEFDVEEYLKKVKEEKDAKIARETIRREKKNLEYDKRIKLQLSNSGPAFEGKLNWCTNGPAQPAQPLKEDPEYPSINTTPSNSPSKCLPNRFENLRSMNIKVVKTPGVSDIHLVAPRPPSTEDTQYIPPSTNRPKPICKFVLANTNCPFGTSCKFSHVLAYRENKVDKKPMKFRMCKNLPNCKFGSACVYAHNFTEFKNAISACSVGIRCKRVRLIEKMYINVGERKCLRLHPHEHIQNFVQRTKVFS